MISVSPGNMASLSENTLSPLQSFSRSEDLSPLSFAFFKYQAGLFNLAGDEALGSDTRWHSSFTLNVRSARS